MDLDPIDPDQDVDFSKKVRTSVSDRAGAMSMALKIPDS